MGNTTCSCTYKGRRSDPDKCTNSDCKPEILAHPRSTTPYDNAPIHLLSTIEFPFDIRDSESDDAIETPQIAKKYSGQYQTPQENLPLGVTYRCNLASNTDTKRTTSLFSSEDAGEELTVQNGGVCSDIYDIILRDFLVTYYPISERIIDEMIVRNLLLPPDVRTVMSQTTDRTKSRAFFDNFVFSEVNICKLATFLHVLVTEKSPIISDFLKSDHYFRSVVDHIYYVVNMASLLTEYIYDEDHSNPSVGICLSSMLNINCGQNLKILRRPSNGICEEGFFIKIVINSVLFSARFWSNFASINEHFHCCQELTLSSCDLGSYDMFNVCRGVINSGILRLLDVSSNPITDNGLKYVEELFVMKNSLVSLNLACCSLTSEGVGNFLDVIASGTAYNHLKHLNISHNDLRDLAEPYILILTKISLTSLEIKSINLRQQRSLFQSLKLNHSLKRVDFSGNQLLSNDISFLAAGLAYNASLKSISMATMGILPMDCSLLNNTLLMNKFLVSIDISDNPIEDEGADYIKDIVTMKKTLRYLFMKRCGISLPGILILLTRVSDVDCNLKLLDLCYNNSSSVNIVVNGVDIKMKIIDLFNHISLVKDVKIKLWGTIDEYK